jgi:hypothetical protein
LTVAHDDGPNKLAANESRSHNNILTGLPRYRYRAHLLTQFLLAGGKSNFLIRQGHQ